MIGSTALGGWAAPVSCSHCSPPLTLLIDCLCLFSSPSRHSSTAMSSSLCVSLERVVRVDPRVELALRHCKLNEFVDMHRVADSMINDHTDEARSLVR